MAKNSERSAMKESSTDERKEKLETAWKELNLAIQNNEQRLKVVESFMATHRQVGVDQNTICLIFQFSDDGKSERN